ncbi:MAG: hypothetical protein ABI333_06230 [bacterium]
MQSSTAQRSGNGPTQAGRVLLRLERQPELTPEFTPLQLPAALSVLWERVSGDLIDHLHCELMASLNPGLYVFPVTDSDPLELEVPDGCVCQAWISANRGLDLEQRKSMVTAAELGFEPAVTLRNVWPTLGRLHTLFDDRDLAVLREQVVKLARSEAAVNAQRMGLDWLSRLEFGLSVMAPPSTSFGQRIEQVKATVTERAGWLLRELGDGAGLLREELKHTSQRLPVVSLSHVSMRPVRRRGGWQLQLRFSGEFGYPGTMMTRFSDLALPRTVLPAPHAVLELLLSANPLASATLLSERLQDRSLARAAAHLVREVEGHFELEGQLPTCGVELPTPDLGRAVTEVSIPRTLALRGKLGASLSPDSIVLGVHGLEIGRGEHLLKAEAQIAIRAREQRDVVLCCVEAGFDGRWPDEELAVSASLTIQPGSVVEELGVALELGHPLAGDTTGLRVELHRMQLEGEVALSTGKPPGESLVDRLDVTFDASVDIPPGSHLEDGVLQFAPTLEDGRLRGRARRTEAGGVDVVLEGQTGIALEGTTQVEAFPELDIDDGELLGRAAGRISLIGRARTGPLHGPVIEIDLSGSEGKVVLDEARIELGARSLELPKGSIFTGRIPQGRLATTGLGQALFELLWDLRGESPVLAAGGQSVEIFVPELRQGMFTVQLSPVGGVSITGNEGGLYDARFFNALINPGAEAERWLEILDDDDAMDKVLGSLRLFSPGAADLLDKVREFTKRVRAIFDRESISKAGDFIPARTIARVLSLVIVDTAELEERVFPLVKQVTDGGGLDVSATKRLLSENLPEHDYEFELDRGLRLLGRMLAPTEPVPPRSPVELLPLAEQPEHVERFAGYPTAAQLNDTVRADAPLPDGFSSRVARVAPYLTLAQLDALLQADRADWQPADLNKLRTVRALKDRVQQIAESYGGMAFVPQAYSISFFIGEAVRDRRVRSRPAADEEGYQIADGLLGPAEVAVLLQSGLASIWDGGPVQITQRLLLDYVLRQPSSFLREVLVEMAGRSPRALTGVLYALLQMEQGRMRKPLDLGELIEERLGVPIPRLADYMAGGRWARESHVEALSRSADLILAEAEPYLALKEYLQVARHDVPPPIHEKTDHRKLAAAAREAIAEADRAGAACTFKGNEPARRRTAIEAYGKAFEACRALRAAEPQAFQLDWFKAFWARNYEALVVRSVVRNHQEDIDQVRHWLEVRHGALPPAGEQGLIDAVIGALYYYEHDREALRADPLVRLLIDPPPGRYDFTIISAMGVITEGARGTELQDAFRRIDEQHGVALIRADTRTARSLEFNAQRIEEAVRRCTTPWGYIGYSQGCANGLKAESMLLGGTPEQQELAQGLRCRNLLFSAGNGSAHGTCGDWKFLRAMIDGDKFLKHYQAVFSSKAINLALNNIGLLLDSRPFVHSQGGVDSLSYAGVRSLSRDGQWKGDVPTSIVRGIVEPDMLPEALEMLSNVLTKQIETTNHDTQVTIEEAVGHPVWDISPFGRVLERCDMGCLVQRTHHWSPLYYATEFVTTARDRAQAIYEFPKDRHVFPWIEVNARFGVIDTEEL